MTMTLNNDIDWSKIADLSDVNKLDRNLIYDSAPQLDDNIHFRKNLLSDELEDAEYWMRFVEGVMIITGDTGGGKGILIHMIAKKMDYYFDKIIVTDTKPRESFSINGKTPIPFSIPMIVEQIDRVKEVQSGIPRPYIIQSLMPGDFEDRDDWKVYRDGSIEDKITELQIRRLIPSDSTFKEYDYNKKQFIYMPNFKPHIDQLTGEWLSSRGKVFIRHSVIVLDEAAAKYIPSGAPNLSEAKVVVNLANIKRHLQALIILVSVDLKDFNPVIFEKVNWHVTCKKLDNKMYQYSDNPDDLVFKAFIDNVKFNPVTETLDKAIGLGDILTINGSSPRHMLNGLGWKDIYNTQNAQDMRIPSRLRRGQ